jgi:hypothetical protein
MPREDHFTFAAEVCAPCPIVSQKLPASFNTWELGRSQVSVG